MRKGRWCVSVTTWMDVLSGQVCHDEGGELCSALVDWMGWVDDVALIEDGTIASVEFLNHGWERLWSFDCEFWKEHGLMEG